MKNPILFVVGSLFAVTLCGALATLTGAAALADPKTLPAQAATETTGATPTATQNPWAEVTASANEAATARAELANQRETAIAAMSTAQAADVERGRLALDTRALEVTAQAGDYAAKATGDANALTLLSGQATKTAGEQAANVAYLQADTERIRAQMDEKNAGTRDILLGVLDAALLLGALSLIGLAWSNWQRATVALEPEPAEQEPLAEFRSTHPGGLSIRYLCAECGVTFEQMQGLAVGLLSGKPFSHSAWTPLSLGGFSEQQFSRVQAFIVAHGRADWADETHKGGLTLNAAGREFFERISPMTATVRAIQRPTRAGKEGTK